MTAPRFRHVKRAGRYIRVADPEWERPLDGRFSAERGARWNAPGSFPAAHLCSTVEIARANVLRPFHGQPYSVLDMPAHRRPELLETEVPAASFVDVVTDAGCRAAGLPESYPRNADGSEVGWDRCRTVGQAAWDAGEPGITCRSAAARPGDIGEELAWFQRGRARLRVRRKRGFDDWFGGPGGDPGSAPHP